MLTVILKRRSNFVTSRKFCCLMQHNFHPQQFRSLIASCTRMNRERYLHPHSYRICTWYICACVYMYHAKAVKGLILKKYPRLYGSSQTEEDKSPRMHPSYSVRFYWLNIRVPHSLTYDRRKEG